MHSRASPPAAQLHASHGGGKFKKMLMIKDSIADITLQQVLTRPKEFDVIGASRLVAARPSRTLTVCGAQPL